MKVLFINENIGGHATVHHHLRQAIADRGDIDATFVDVPAAGLGRRFVGAQIPGLARLDLDFQPLRAQLAHSNWVRKRLPKLAADADVIHIYTQNTALLSAGFLRQHATVVTTDSTNQENCRRLPYREPAWATGHIWKAARWFENRVFGAASTVVANSEWVAGSMRTHYDIDATKIEVIPFGIVAPPRVERAPNRRPRIIFVGRQFDRKGGFDLLTAFNDSVADRADLILVTKDPVPAHPNVTVISDLEAGDQRLWELLGSADIFAFPSPIDQAPNAVLEAMASGLPVIAVSTAALPEMVRHGESGLLIDSGDRKALAAALAQLVDDPVRRLEMGRVGRKHFDEHYDAEVAVDHLVAVFHRVDPSNRVAG